MIENFILASEVAVGQELCMIKTVVQAVKMID